MSSMEDGNRRRKRTGEYSGGMDGSDAAAMNAFSDSFSQVQTVFDRNRELIQQANENHQSRMSDNMVKNVAIIKELNDNISRVASIYSDLSSNFSGEVHNRRQGGGRDGGDRSNS